MKSLDSVHYALSTCVAVVMLTGCGGSQPLIGAPGAMAQSRAIAAHTSRRAPASGEDLLYATGGCGGACVLSYPQGKLVESVSISVGPTGLGGDCSDSAGDVFITNDTEVLEYVHGGTSPIATLGLPGNEARACSIDPKTGNLAVVFSGSNANLAIFPNAQGSPSLYTVHIVSLYCGYDSAGNLFVSGYYDQESQLAELQYGSANFTTLTINGNVGTAGQVQWDGKHMTDESRSSNKIKVSRFTISGSTATVVGVTRFSGGLTNAYQSWIYGGRILIPYSIRGQRVNKIGIWAYPRGDKQLKKFGNFGQGKFAKFMGVTVSVAQGHS
jgi:hypothetical protein